MERTCLCLLFWPTIASRWVRLLLFVTQVATKPTHICSTWEYYRNIFAQLAKWKYPPDNRGQSYPRIILETWVVLWKADGATKLVAVQLLARLIISISGHFGRERGERLDNE